MGKCLQLWPVVDISMSHVWQQEVLSNWQEINSQSVVLVMKKSLTTTGMQIDYYSFAPHNVHPVYNPFSNGKQKERIWRKMQKEASIQIAAYTAAV